MVIVDSLRPEITSRRVWQDGSTKLAEHYWQFTAIYLGQLGASFFCGAANRTIVAIPCASHSAATIKPLNGDSELSEITLEINDLREWL